MTWFMFKKLPTNTRNFFFEVCYNAPLAPTALYIRHKGLVIIVQKNMVFYKSEW